MHYIHFFLNIMKIIEIIIVHKSNHLWRKKKTKKPNNYLSRYAQCTNKNVILAIYN